MNQNLLIAITVAYCSGIDGTILAQSVDPSRAIEPIRPNLPTLPQILPSVPPLKIEPEPTLPIQPFTEIEDKVAVKEIEVLGSTVFSKAKLDEVTKPFIGKTLTFEQLLSVRSAINNLYISHGYATSGAFLPVQDFTQGKLLVQVVEGEIESVEIKGLERLKPSYLRSRLEEATKAPVSIAKLESALQLLQLNPLFKSINADLSAGSSPGRNVLLVNLQEAPPINTTLVFDNKEPPSVGSIGGTAVVSYDNLLGLGDRASALVGITQGVNSYNLSYDVPVNARNGTVGLRYSRGRNRVVENPFAPLDITGRAETYAIDYRQPVILTPKEELAFGVSAQLRRSRTFLFNDEPFSFTQGPENGESKASVLRLNTDWVKRSSNNVLAASSSISLGLGIFDATVNDTGTDGRFVSWQGQFQWLRALNEEKDAVAIARIVTQLTPDSLLPLEQFAIGGIDSVRGYRTNQAVASNGFFGSLEVRLPIVRPDSGFGLIQLTPFVDIGSVWGDNSTATLLSTGLGFRWQLGNSLSAQVNWGIPLISSSDLGSSLQDNGISFALQINPF